MAPDDHFVVETTFRVRYAETDSMRIVHHSRYLVYFEEARSEYARQRGRPYSDFEASGYFLTVTEVRARYVKPARYEQTITVKAWITEMKSRGLVFNYEIVDAETGDLLVLGHSRHICIDREGKIARLPDEWRDWS